MSELIPSHGNAGTENEPGQKFSRREFLYFAGIGAASLAFSSPFTKAFGLEAAEADSVTAATTAAAAAADRVVGWLHWDDHGDTATPFIFEPSFFSGGAMTYNAHLATFGCCLAVSAINAEAGGGADKKYRNQYRNIRSLMNQIGVEDGDIKSYSYDCDGVTVDGSKAGNVAWNSAYERQPTYSKTSTPKATIGLCMGHRKITVDGQEYNLVLLGVRGGNYEIEWCSNVTVGATGNHEGFQEAAEMAARFLKCHIREYGLTGPTKILISGQSRAGATTNLTSGNIVKYAIEHGAAKLSDKEGYDISSFFGGNVKVRQCDLYGYGYGVPAGVLAESAEAKTKVREDYGNVHNITNPCDLVPKVAPAAWDFKRYGVDKVLPGPRDRAHYTRGRDKMLDRMYALGLHRSGHFSYALDDFPAIDYELLKGKGAYVEKMYDMSTLDVYVEEFFNLLATDVLHARVKKKLGPDAGIFQDEGLPGYTMRYQDAIITAMELYVRFPQDEQINAKGADGKSPLEKFMETAKGLITPHIFDLYMKITSCTALTDITDYVTTAMKQTKITDTETFDQRYGDRVRSVLDAILKPDCCTPDGQALSRYSSFSAFAKAHTKEVIAFLLKGGTIMSAHNSELCLSWLQSRDSYYNKYGKGDLPDAPAVDPLKATSTAATAAVAAAGDEELAAAGDAASGTDVASAGSAAAGTAAASAAGSADASEAADASGGSSTDSAAAGTAGTAAAAAATAAASDTAASASSTTETTDAVDADGKAAGDEADSVATAAAITTQSDSESSSATSASSVAAGDEAADANSAGATVAAAVPAAGATATLSATDDEDDDATDDNDPGTYRKVFFDGGTSISYVVNGTSYEIFKDGRAIFADEDSTMITVEGQECPFAYGLDSDLQQAIYLSDRANFIDGGTDYTFKVTTEPDAPLKCTAASYDASNGFPASLFIYESPVGCYGEPLEDYRFTVKLSELDGDAYSASHDFGESFWCDFDTAGVTSNLQATTTTEKDSGDDIATRHYFIDARSANTDKGGTVGGGTSLRGTVSTVEAIPFDGYEFDYWTIDDKWMVDGVETSPYYWYEFTYDDEGNLVSHEPESIPEGEWVEGERREGEMIEDAHLYRIVADADHRVTAHFKAKATTPAANEGTGGADKSAEGTGMSKAKTTPKTGDGTAASAVAAAALAAGAGAVAMKAAKEAACENDGE